MLWYGPRGKIDDSKYSKFYERKVCWGTSCAGSGGYIRIPRQKNCPGLSEAVHNSITDNSMKEPETILASSSGRRMEPHFLPSVRKQLLFAIIVNFERGKNAMRRTPWTPHDAKALQLAQQRTPIRPEAGHHDCKNRLQTLHPPLSRFGPMRSSALWRRPVTSAICRSSSA